MAGEHLTKPPYGYKVDPNDRKKWIVDEEAAAVVKRIFDLCVAGNGPMRIAKILKAEDVYKRQVSWGPPPFPVVFHGKMVFYWYI